MIDRATDAFLPRTIRTAEIVLVGLDAMSYDLTTAMRANRRQLVYRAFETIEDVPVTGRNNFKRKVIVVAANFATRHKKHSLPGDVGVGNEFKKRVKGF